MKICFMCDLHLPFDKNALQYDILEWAISDIQKKKPDCIAYAGDVTSDGNLEIYKWFVERMIGLEIPFLFIPGNSDLRCQANRSEMKHSCSKCENEIDGIKVFAVNDCDSTVSDAQFSELEKADDNSVVFMHHPIKALSEPHREKMLRWRENHKGTFLFYGHLHETRVDENNISLQAMDPDKAIGECPCITYFDTETKKTRQEYYFSPVPRDLYEHFGVSCYDTVKHIEFCVANGLKNLELRPNCINCDQSKLLRIIAKWRECGGENLCVHLPDVCYNDGNIKTSDMDFYIALANTLKVDRLTQHVPIVSVEKVNADAEVLEGICSYLAERLNLIDHEIVIGVENMHMTAKDKADGTRRFGYLPEECIVFMKTLQKKCKHKVGINFDIGHARNNIPYSQKYQISTWLSQIGKYAVGYHIHQVTYNGSVFSNHMPINDIYGKLISFASFFKYWSKGVINKAPVIFEMRPQDAYDVTLETFLAQKSKNVFDIHTHSYYSACGKDTLEEMIDTAIEHGISVFGISDHNRGIGNRKAEYLHAIRGLAEEYKNRIRLLCGIEIATIPERFDIWDTSEIQDYDYCLIEHITDKESVVGKNLFEFCKRLGIRCGIAHTDLFAYCDMYGFAYEEFFAKMAENNIFWEMNVAYDSIHKYNEHKYVFDFMADKAKMEIIKNAEVVISIGSDSHRCEEYNGFRLYQMYDFLKANGFKTFDETI